MTNRMSTKSVVYSPLFAGGRHVFAILMSRSEADYIRAPLLQVQMTPARVVSVPAGRFPSAQVEFNDRSGTLLEPDRCATYDHPESDRPGVQRVHTRSLPDRPGRDDSCGTSRCPLLRLRGGEEIRPWERTLKLPDGQSVTCRANAFPIRDETQRIVGVFECLEVVQPAASRRSDLGSQDDATSYLEDLVALVGRLRTPDVSLGRVTDDAFGAGMLHEATQSLLSTNVEWQSPLPSTRVSCVGPAMPIAVWTC